MSYIGFMQAPMTAQNSQVAAAPGYGQAMGGIPTQYPMAGSPAASTQEQPMGYGLAVASAPPLFPAVADVAPMIPCPNPAPVSPSHTYYPEPVRVNEQTVLDVVQPHVYPSHATGPSYHVPAALAHSHLQPAEARPQSSSPHVTGCIHFSGTHIAPSPYNIPAASCDNPVACAPPPPAYALEAPGGLGPLHSDALVPGQHSFYPDLPGSSFPRTDESCTSGGGLAYPQIAYPDACARIPAAPRNPTSMYGMGALLLHMRPGFCQFLQLLPQQLHVFVNQIFNACLVPRQLP